MRSAVAVVPKDIVVRQVFMLRCQEHTESIQLPLNRLLLHLVGRRNAHVHAYAPVAPPLALACRSGTSQGGALRQRVEAQGAPSTATEVGRRDPSAAARRESWSFVDAPASGDSSDPPQGALCCEGYGGVNWRGSASRGWRPPARSQLKIRRQDRTMQNLSFVIRPSTSIGSVSNPCCGVCGRRLASGRWQRSNIGSTGAT